MMNNIMIDIETLDNVPGCAILQIGAVRFDEETGALANESFIVNVSLNSCLDAGLTVNESTFKWWMHQDDNARKMLFSPLPMKLGSALNELAKYINRDDYIWCHANFDMPCLDVAFRKAGVNPPWKYSNVRDLRTYFATRRFDPKTDQKDDPNLVRHNAIGDCLWQIAGIQAARAKAGF